jgi:glycosyltransferase involved in cell wall biosynthesis
MSTLLASPLADRFEMRRVATHRDGSKWAKLAQAASGLARVAVSLARGWPDLVWVHSSADASLRRKSVVVALCRLFRTPVVFHVHGSGMERYHRAAPPWEQALVRRTLRTADLVIALGPTWERKLLDMTPCVVACVLNPVDVPDAPPPASLRRPGRIVCTGRLGERKGSLVLVRALARIADRFPEAHLVLAGDGDAGPVHAEAAALGVADRVETTGWVGPDEVAGLLDTASVFALPSRDEGLPVALLEAMSRTVPCVVSPVGGIPDLVVDGELGLLVPHDDPEALGGALARLLGDPDEAARIGRAGREAVLARCATPVVAAAVGRCFAQVLRGEVPAARRGAAPAGG